MSHLSLRTNNEDEFHLRFLEQMLGLDRSQATRAALSIAVDYLKGQKTDKIQILRDSDFIGGDHSKEITRVGFRKRIKAKLEVKFGLGKKKQSHH